MHENDKIFAEAGAALLDDGGFKAAMQKLVLVENLLDVPMRDVVLEALGQDGAVEGLARILSDAVHQYFKIASKAEAELEKKYRAKKDG